MKHGVAPYSPGVLLIRVTVGPRLPVALGEGDAPVRQMIMQPGKPVLRFDSG